jgi:hypothetical protein
MNRRLSSIWPSIRPTGRAAVALAGFLLAPAWLAVAPASAATLNVCPHGCAYSQVAAAVAAAGNGDTVNIAAGTYHGGLAIDKSLTLNGAGARQTTIRGGGPVITVGTYNAAVEPTVAIRGVTITGGVTGTSPESIPFLGVDGAWGAGGGVEIPPNATLSGGATVTISNSAITGNRVDPTSSVAGFPCPGLFPPSGQCPFAPAFGGGIDSWGTLTLLNSTISDNSAGSTSGLASDADGGGIYSDQGSLTLLNTTVSGNQAIAHSPNGRYAEGGGINVTTQEFGEGGGNDALTVKDSVITDNTAALTSGLPSFFGGQFQNLNANSGGIVVGPGIPATVDNTSMTDNSAIAHDPNGEPSAIDAAMHVNDGPLIMSNSFIARNQAITDALTSADVGPAGSAIEADGGGTISNTAIIENYATMDTPNGAAAVNGGLGVFGNTSLLTIRNSTISRNTATALSTTGSASVQGAGVFNDGLLELINSRIAENSGTATAPAGEAQGGGVWNGDEFTGPPVQLTLQNTAIIRNSLTASPGLMVQGAGLFTTPPATTTLTHALIAHNTPDQCFGC